MLKEAADRELNMSQKLNFDHKENNLENGGMAGHQDIFFFPLFFFLNTGKIVHIFHLKANNVGEGDNTSNQHFLHFLFLFFQRFLSQWHKKLSLFRRRIKCWKKKQNNALVESYVKFLFSENICNLVLRWKVGIASFGYSGYRAGLPSYQTTVIWNSKLTLSKTTIFRLFQTERVCRRQFQFWSKWQNVFQTSRKHGGKRRNCSLRAIFPYPTVEKGEIARYEQFLLIPQCFLKICTEDA